MQQDNIQVMKEVFWPAVFIAGLASVIAVFPKFIINFGWASDDFLSIYEGVPGILNWVTVLIIQSLYLLSIPLFSIFSGAKS